MKERRVASRWRGLGLRSLAMLLGLIVALGIVLGIQWGVPVAAAQLVGEVPNITWPSPTPLQWPTQGESAIDIPSAGVLATNSEQTYPIASLTKMMTAYVVLHDAPLTPGQSGPCMTIRAGDVATLAEMKRGDNSYVNVATGEQLCESQLLNGLLVHSANNFAVLLATLVAGNPTTFVAQMNTQAEKLGLTHTAYVDVDGVDPGDASTASDQVRLAAIIMRNPLIRHIVAQPAVTLPIAGTVFSYTPGVGSDGIIGVKSGRTSAAGGCDVMAREVVINGRPRLLLSAVLDQRGGDVLRDAGAAALDLQNQMVTPVHFTLPPGTVVGSYSWDHHVVTVATASPLTLTMLPLMGGAMHYDLTALPHVTSAPQGAIVGFLRPSTGSGGSVDVVTTAPVPAPTWWERLGW